MHTESYMHGPLEMKKLRLVGYLGNGQAFKICENS